MLIEGILRFNTKTLIVDSQKEVQETYIHRYRETFFFYLQRILLHTSKSNEDTNLKC